MDGLADVPEAEGEYPAYGAWCGAPEESPYDLGCAAKGMFCFFCEYQSGGCPNDAGDDLRASLESMARGLLVSRQEPRVVARLLHGAYNDTVRQHVEFEGPGGKLVCKPDWAIESIERHLMFSTEYTQVFASWMQRSYQGMLVRIGNKLVTNDGRVCPVAAKQFTTTTKSYLELQRALKTCFE